MAITINHTLPMFTEFQFNDIVFGIFPKVGGEMAEAYDRKEFRWRHPSHRHADASVRSEADLLCELGISLTIAPQGSFIHSRIRNRSSCAYPSVAIPLTLAYVGSQDAFRDNFLVQWQPESMLTMTVPVSRPRIDLIDFEVAISFPAEYPLAECVCTGPPGWLIP
jgi:hypothetical protein